MKIEFRKVPYSESEFEKSNNGLKCKGIFKKSSNIVIVLKLGIEGFNSINCDICGKLFDMRVDEKISLKIYDGVSDSEDLDIIECQDHIIDFDEIIDSEIACIKSDYYYCEKCK